MGLERVPLLFTMAGMLFIIVSCTYKAISKFLNKFNKLVYGKGTAMAWIPVFNLYLLGKLTINEIAGFILVICLLLTNTGIVLPKSIKSVVAIVYYLVVLGLFIYAIVKYNRLKKNSANNIQQPSQPQQLNQSPPIMNQEVTQPSQQQTFMNQNEQPSIENQMNVQNNNDNSSNMGQM